MTAPTSTPTVADLHADYVRAHEAAQAVARLLVGRRVEWMPFGRAPERRFAGRVTRVDLGGVMVRWDDLSFWGGTKPHALNPADLAVAS